MPAAIILLALVADLVLIWVAVGHGFSGHLGPLRFTLHDPGAASAIAAGLVVALAAVVTKWRRGRWLPIPVAIVTVAAAGAIMARAAVRMSPLGDIAALELAVRAAAAGRVLVGPYSRFGWHHPGPFDLYLSVGSYIAGGRNPAALSAAAATIAIGALTVIAYLTARVCRAAASLGIVAAFAAYFWRLPDLLTSAWNPHVVAMPTVALIVSGAAASDDLMWLPLVAVLASFVAQTDIALVPLSAVVGATALVMGVARKRGQPLDARPWRILNVTAWLLAALWFLPLAEEVSHSPGNITLIWNFFIHNTSHGQPLIAAFRAWASMLAAVLLPSEISLGGGSLLDDTVPAAAVVVAVAEVIALISIAVWARRTRQPGLARLVLFAFVSDAVALISLTRIVGDGILDYEVFWITALGVLNAGIIGGSVVCVALDRFRHLTAGPAWTRALVQGLPVGVAAFLCLNQIDRARLGHLPVTLSSPYAARFSSSVRVFLDDHHFHRPLMIIGSDVWSMAAGVLLELDRAGVPVAVEHDWLEVFPPPFAADGREDVDLSVSDTDEHLVLAARPGNMLVTRSETIYIDALPRDARAR